MSETWPFKDPDEILDYDIDWTFRLYSPDELAAAIAQQDAGLPLTIVPADTVDTSEFTLPAGSLIANSATNSTTATKVWLTGGDLGETYEILNRITTAGGRVMDLTVKLKIKSK